MSTKTQRDKATQNYYFIKIKLKCPTIDPKNLFQNKFLSLNGARFVTLC